MSASVICYKCGMVLEVLGIANYTLLEGYVGSYYHVPDLNEHMQLHEED